ncbi:MAG: alpha/beta hydrolase [Sphingobacteriales bacterium]|nr:MAG: alpha/beta hydrolase [Sphingobacteriales bacterium]
MSNLLFLHGALGDTSQVEFLVNEFPEFRAAGINFRGHGWQKTSDGGEFTIQDFAQDAHGIDLGARAGHRNGLAGCETGA